MKGNLSYQEVVDSATKYGRVSGFSKNHPMYSSVVEWLKTLKDAYRVKLVTYTVVKKILEDSSEYDLIVEFYHKTKFIAVGLCHKDMEV